MPELPDIEAYLHALEPRVIGHVLRGIRIANPFLLRSVSPRPDALAGRRAVALRRIGKRIAIGLEGDDWIVLHLMIAGRLHWARAGAPIPGGKRGLAAFDFDDGSLVLTEAGTKKRASLHLVAGAGGLAEHDPGGIDPMTCGAAEFATALRAANHTLKRSLTDPRTFSGIGNAYSDEILHRARLSPVAMSQSLDDQEVARLHAATVAVLAEWRDRLCAEADQAFPEKVTAFRPEMAVHGKFGAACPVCGAPVQRIRYADNETDYCPRCQTEGRILADRSLSRLLKQDWPRTLEALEQAGLASRGSAAQQKDRSGAGKQGRSG
jgi:formamidopyrimidine-DNA glycosylase